MRFREMCQIIVDADVIRKDDDSKFTPREIFEISPTGELWPVFELYDLALQKMNGLAIAKALIDTEVTS